MYHMLCYFCLHWHHCSIQVGPIFFVISVQHLSEIHFSATMQADTDGKGIKAGCYIHFYMIYIYIYQTTNKQALQDSWTKSSINILVVASCD